MRVRRGISAVTIAAMLITPAVFAADIQVRPVPCVSAAQNPQVLASLASTTRSARVYFKAEGQTAEYYLDMRHGENGSWFAFMPMPEAATHAIVYRVVPTDDKGLQSSSAALTTNVAAACAPQNLTADEQRIALNLAVGLTSDSQSPVPTGFQCRGVVSYITASGKLKPNNECRRILAAAAGGAGAGAGGAAAGGATIAGMSAGTFAALVALGAGAGYAIYHNNNKSTTPTSPSHP